MNKKALQDFYFTKFPTKQKSNTSPLLMILLGLYNCAEPEMFIVSSVYSINKVVFKSLFIPSCNKKPSNKVS